MTFKPGDKVRRSKDFDSFYWTRHCKRQRFDIKDVFTVEQVVKEGLKLVEFSAFSFYEKTPTFSLSCFELSAIDLDQDDDDCI